jgi:hypothetical protein
VGYADERMSSGPGPLVYVDECWCARDVPTRGRRCTAYLCEYMDTGGWPCDMAQRREEVLCVAFRMGGRGHTFRKSARFFNSWSDHPISLRSFFRLFGCNKNDTIRSLMMHDDEERGLYRKSKQKAALVLSLRLESSNM